MGLCEGLCRRIFWEGCLENGASQQPCLFLPEPSAWGTVTELPACCSVGSLVSVPPSFFLTTLPRAHTQHPASVS